MAESIEMPFGFWTRVGPRNHALGEGPDPPVDNFRRTEYPTELVYRDDIHNGVYTFNRVVR